MIKYDLQIANYNLNYNLKGKKGMHQKNILSRAYHVIKEILVISNPALSLLVWRPLHPDVIGAGSGHRPTHPVTGGRPEEGSPSPLKS